jgi:hypothetical protein
MFIIRSKVSAADFVCKVESTKCHVRLALVAVSSVSLSLISQTIIISGSCLRIALNQFLNVNPFFSLTSA